jgi:hypothetical protein
MEDGRVNPKMHPRKFGVQPWYKPQPKMIFGKELGKLTVLVNWHNHVRSQTYVLFSADGRTEEFEFVHCLRSDGYRLEVLGPIHLETRKRNVLNFERILKSFHWWERPKLCSLLQSSRAVQE